MTLRCILSDTELRELFALELEKHSDRLDMLALATNVRAGIDNSFGGVAAIEAMRQACIKAQTIMADG